MEWEYEVRLILSKQPVVITNVFVINFVNKPPPLRPWQQTLKLTDNALKRTLKLTDNAMKWDRNVSVNNLIDKLIEKDVEPGQQSL